METIRLCQFTVALFQVLMKRWRCSYQSYGGHITLDGEFGHDPLRIREDLLEIREERFFNQCPKFEEIFHSVVNYENRLFQSSLLYFIEISKQLETQL